MKFRSEIQINPLKKLTHESHVLLIGSCFSQHMYQFLSQMKVSLCYNPYGITYNPCSIAEQITSLFHNIPPKMYKVDNSYIPFQHHGSFRKNTKEDTEREIQCHWKEAIQQITSISDVCITLGSAFAWFRDGMIINNCHKRPSTEFSRQLLEIDTIVVALQKSLQLFPPHTNITFTVSPIRHIRDGLIENNLSKSILRAAIHLLQQEDTRIQYFPAFEIMMDDLRDYRFYESDLMHPSPMAIQYIFEHVRTHMIDISLQKREVEFQKIYKRLEHKPLHPQSEEWRTFVRKTRSLLTILEKEYPQLDWTKEEEMWTQLSIYQL